MVVEPKVDPLDFSQPIEAPPSNVSYVSPAENQQPDETQKILPGTPSVAEIREYNRLNNVVNPLLDLSPDQIVKLQVDDPDHFNLVESFRQNKALWADQDTVDKTADALHQLRERGFKFSDLPGPKKILSQAGSVIKGGVKNIWNLTSGTGEYLSAAAMQKIDEAMGLSAEPTEKAKLEGQRKVAESLSGSESAVVGMAEQGKRALEKLDRFTGLSKPLSEFTPQDKADALWDSVGVGQTLDDISKGHGAAMQAAGGNVVKELEQTGNPVRPEQVQELSAGDPFTFWAFGKAFQGLHGLTPGIVRQTGTALAGDLGEIAQKAGGKTLEKLGDASVVLAKGTKNAADVAPVIGAAAGLAKGGPWGVLGGIKAGEIVQSTIKKIAKKVEVSAKGVSEVGKQIADETIPVESNAAQLGRDVLQSIPGAVGDVAKGAGLDLGIAATTSESPQETQGVGLGTVFGLGGAVGRVGLKAVSGQLIAPRAYGSANPGTTSRQFPTLDALHNGTYAASSPGVRTRVNAIRQFMKGIDPSADVFLADKDDPAKTAKALTDAGLSPEQAKLWAEQNGVHADNFGGRRVILLNDADAAPHEAFHGFQDVLGEAGNREVDKLVQDSMTPERWEYEGEKYARDLKAGWDGKSDWREHILEKTGEGLAAALEKMILEYQKANTGPDGKPVSSEDAKAAVTKNFEQVVNDYLKDNPIVPKGDVVTGIWKNVLGADGIREEGDRYMAREHAAESFDSLFKHTGGSMKDPSGLLPKLAKIVGNTVSILGGNPLAGRESAVRGTPLSPEVIEKIRGQVADRMAPEVAAPAKIPGARATPLPSGSPVPITSDDRKAAGDEAKEIAAGESAVPTAAGLRSPKELLGDIALAISDGSAVKLNYSSAPEEPAAAISSNRNTRRKMIEIFRTMPEAARRLWEKNFFPERVRRTKTGAQVGGWSPEVFASNAHKTAQAIIKIGDAGLSPYPLDAKTGSFTEEGWKQLYEDTQKFVQNQVAGRTGSGGPLVVPKMGGYFAPPETGASAGLEQRKADFINSLFGYKLPGTARISNGGKLPLNAAGQRVSEATMPGRVEIPVRPRGEYTGPKAEQLGIEGQSVAEVNPWRNELEAAAKAKGVAVPSVIEAFQWLNLDRIKEVAATPEQPEFRGNTLTLQSGFQPMPANPRAVKSAAVRDREGRIFEGAWHGEAYLNAQQASGERGNLIDGFTTNNGEFLTRDEALERALQLKQVDPKKLGQFGRGEETLESAEFGRARQFQPASRPIELEGPDGKKYKALFDGYQDFTALGMGHVPQITPLEDLPGLTVKHSTTYGVPLEKAGYKLPELPPAQFQPKRLKEVTDVAEAYAKENGIDYKPETRYADYPRKLGKRLSDFYQKEEHNPDAPEVKKSYDAFKRETLEQYRAIEKAGYTLEPLLSVDSPYKNGSDVAKDVEKNKHLYFNLSEAAFGQPTQSEHQLLLEPSGIELGGKTITFNDLFRAVHDFFGHAQNSFSFGPIGEFNAWREHSNLYSQEAQGALAAETLAQGAWVHFNEEYNKGLRPGEKGFVSYDKRPFAEQKNIVIPQKMIEEARSQFAPKKRNEMKFDPTSFNQATKAWILPNGKVEQIGAQWHHQWLDENPEVQKKYGLRVPPFEGNDAEGVREAALKKGFSRVNLENGNLVVEAREKDWRHLKPKVEDLIENNIDDVDKFRVYLLDDNIGKVKRSYSSNLFDADTDKEKMERVYDTFSEQPGAELDKAAAFSPGSSDFSHPDFEDNLEKVRSGESFGHTFNRDGSEWTPSPKSPTDIVTLASVNIPQRNLTPERFQEAIKPYQDLLDSKDVKVGVFNFDRDGKPYTSIDINAAVPQEFRANSLKFAKDNDQIAIWDAAKNETVNTGGNGDTRLTDPDHLVDAVENLITGKPVDVAKLSQSASSTPQEEQGSLFGFKEAIPKKQVKGMTYSAKKDVFPEALVFPRERKGNGELVDKKIESDIVGSPLYKKSADPVKAFADKLVDFANQWQNHPFFKSGLRWYSEFVPMLKEKFGKDATRMAQLLAATSPQTNPKLNYAYALDALEGFKSGRFDKQLDKFKQGMAMMNDGSWLSWYNRELNAGNIPEAPATPTADRFLEAWIDKHNLKPLQSNGKLYGQHSLPVLQVFADIWLNENRGPKTLNFVKNLLGLGNEATIDVWADRTMRRIGYEGYQDRWRILPQNATGVSDADFEFSQKAFRAAADRLGIEADALQGALWFAEKGLWAENGWGNLDLGDYRKEIVKTDLLKKGIEQRLTIAKNAAKNKGSEQVELSGLVEPRKVK